VLTLGTSLPVSAYRTGPAVRSLYTRMLDAVQNLPGVSAAGASTFLPLDVREHRGFRIENERHATLELSHTAAGEWVMGGYFEALGIPLKRGRLFSAQDSADSEPVVIINETLAHRYWRGADPVGQRIAWGDRGWMRIVGVVGDVKQGPLHTETIPQAYAPWLQVSDGALADNVVGMMRSMKLAIRTERDPMTMASTVRQQIRALDPSLPVTGVRTMDEVIRMSASTQRFNTMLLGSFALLALLLAAIGIGGVLATSVSRRTQELGVRMALGAQRQTLLGMVVREGMVLAGLGVVAGLPIAWMTTRLMSALLFDISPRDPLTFTGVGLLVAAVALAACSIPAWRATRVDPMVALRRD
jgi:putative ABC transport system permease protein